jgi:hypothetical protein
MILLTQFAWMDCAERHISDTARSDGPAITKERGQQMKKVWLSIIIGSAVGAVAASAQAPVEPPKAATSWADKVTLKGDVRLRYEEIDEEGKDNRERWRVRARLGAFAKTSSELDVAIQFSTTEKNDPVSSNQTLTDSFSRKDGYIDLAYFDYHPEVLPGFRVIGGKMEQPFYRTSDLIYDNDLNPEGVAAKFKGGDALSGWITAAYLPVQERATDDETSLMGAQIGTQLKNEESKQTFTAGASYYTYDNIEGFNALGNDPTTGRGNSTDKVTDDAGKVTAATYKGEYNIVELFADAAFDVGIPVKVYGDYVINNDAFDEDTGYLVGLTLGKTKDPGSFDFDYNYRSLDNDAVVGAFTDSDSFGGGTDGEGHRFSLGYQLSKGLKANATYFMNEKAMSKDGVDYDRLQLDLVAKL